MDNITNIYFDELIPDVRVYFRNNEQDIVRTIEYIRNPNQVNPNTNIVLNQLPFGIIDNDFLNDLENQTNDETKRIIIIKFIGHENEELCAVNLNDNNKVTISVMGDDFLFYDTDLYKITPPVQKTRGKTGGKRRLSKKRKLFRKKRKLSRKKK